MLVGQIKADLDAVDEEGDSALHMVLHKQSSINSEINENEAPSIYGVSFLQIHCFRRITLSKTRIQEQYIKHKRILRLWIFLLM